MNLSFKPQTPVADGQGYRMFVGVKKKKIYTGRLRSVAGVGRR